MNQDEIKSAAKDVVGKVQDAGSHLTGDAGMQADGKSDRAAGRISDQIRRGKRAVR